jgi:spore coat polysaccharide biosynthesis protein SpsF
MILAILQARMSSTRLPGKVLKLILGRPMLSLQVERVLHSRRVDQLIVATSTEKIDDGIVHMCSEMKVACYRGSLNDVLDRFYQAALQYKPKHVVRLTGDCPLIDPEIIDEVIGFHLDGSFDYATNSIEPFTFPDGLDVEIFKSSVLQFAWNEASLPLHREHVTPFIRSNPERFKIGRYENQTNLSHLRWTVDEHKDFEFVSRVYEALYSRKNVFTTQDILGLLKRDPSLVKINSDILFNSSTDITMI